MREASTENDVIEPRPPGPPVPAICDKTLNRYRAKYKKF